MDVRMLEKDRFYRNCLDQNVGHGVKLTCSDFEIRERNDGEKFLLLCNPEIIKIDHKRGKQRYPIKLNHLWVKAPEGFETYLGVARKIQVIGQIAEYPYKDKGTKQVGVKAKKVSIVKFRKDIAKRYGLSPNTKPTKEVLQEILAGH